MMKDDTETTLRAVVDGQMLVKIKLPSPVKLTSVEARMVAQWARPFSGTCMTDVEIYVSDIKPSNAAQALGDLEPGLAKRLKTLVTTTMRHGFGLRIMREDPTEPYRISTYRRVIDIPQLTIPYRSMRYFMKALGLGVEVAEAQGQTLIPLDVFARNLDAKYDACMDAGCAHYRAHSVRIVEYGRANNATEIAWGAERRGAVPDEPIATPDE